MKENNDTINSLKRDLQISEKKLIRSKQLFEQELLGGLGEDIKRNRNFDGYYPVVKDNRFKRFIKRVIKWFTKS